MNYKKERPFAISYNRYYPRDGVTLNGNAEKDLSMLNDYMRWLDSILGTEEEEELLRENSWLEELRIDIAEWRYTPRPKPGDISELRVLFNKLRFIGLTDLRGEV